MGGTTVGNGDSVNMPSESAPGSGPTPVKSPDAKLVTPTLVTYFGVKPVAPAAFVKAVRDARIARFADADVQESATLMAAHDADCRRLLALASQLSRPEAVERWLWPVVQRRLKDLVPGEFDLFESNASFVLRSLHRQLSGLLDSKEAEKRKKAEVAFLLGLKWLLAHRGLNVTDAIDEIRLALSIEGEPTRKAARRMLVQGKLSDLRNAAAIATLMGESGREARRALEAETVRLIDMRSELNAAQAENNALKAVIEGMAKERDAFAVRAEQAELMLKDSKQHWGHDMANTKTQQAVFLKGRLSPLLNDAMDALEISPPEAEIALSRVKSAMASIEDALK
jgi:hypothetical protein